MKKTLFLILMISFLNANIFNNEEEARKTGDYVQIALPAYAVLLSVYNDDFIEGNKQFIPSFLATQLSVEVLKRIVREERPNKSNKLSFPSGHSAASFSAASFIHKRYGIKQAIIPYVLASYVGYSRIKAKKHYFHDVLAGALIAGGFNYFLVDKKITISPVNKGFLVSKSFKF